MPFEQFVRAIDVEIRAAVPDSVFDEQRSDSVAWRARERRAAMTLVPPMNVKVEFMREAVEPDAIRWYPVDPAVVRAVTQRITGFLIDT